MDKSLLQRLVWSKWKKTQKQYKALKTFAYNVYFLFCVQDVQNLTPATDFYKKFALDCAAEQVAVDLFLLSGQYSDIATLSKSAKQGENYDCYRSSKNLKKLDLIPLLYLVMFLSFDHFSVRIKVLWWICYVLPRLSRRKESCSGREI